MPLPVDFLLSKYAVLRVLRVHYHVYALDTKQILSLMLKDDSQAVLDLMQSFSRLFKIYGLALLCEVASLQRPQLLHIVIFQIFPPNGSCLNILFTHAVKNLTYDCVTVHSDLYVVVDDVLAVEVRHTRLNKRISTIIVY